jgi:type II secretory pathway pseudopilin PulG
MTSGRGARVGFTLVEILVTVALLSFIVLGLLSMFLQTQRAFRTSMTQVDVLEAGRSVTDLLARELEQITPSQLTNTVNFYAQLSPFFSPPLMQGLPGNPVGASGQVSRTNIVQNFFFLTQNNQNWIGTGYAVMPLYNQAGVGALYRFTTNVNRATIGQLLASFQVALVRDLQNLTNGRPATNFQRVADGVVHARLRTFAPDGFPIVATKPPTNGQFRIIGTNGLPAFNALNFPLYTNVHNTLFIRNGAIPDVVDCSFVSNAVPAYVEFELGILEPPVLERYKSIGSSSPALQGIQRQFLSNHVAQVHLFRQRIAVRNVDFKAYPVLKSYQ